MEGDKILQHKLWRIGDMPLLTLEQKLTQIRREFGRNLNWGELPKTHEIFYVWYGIIVSPGTDLWSIDREPAKVLFPTGHHGGGIELSVLTINSTISVENVGKRAYLLKLRGVARVCPCISLSSHEFRLKRLGTVSFGQKIPPFCCEFSFDEF